MPFAYLDIENPICAWATYRGKLALPPNDSGFVSVWLTGLVRSGDSARYQREVALEIVRSAKFPQNISRLRCIFCFETKNLALKALAWGGDGRNHFQQDSLAELSFEEPIPAFQRFDANWISHSDGLNKSETSWMESYWAGDPFPGANPHWETLCVGNLTVHDVEIRRRAYENLRAFCGCRP